MFVYAGIDEAGYGPMFGPLMVARSVFAIPKLPSPAEGGSADPPHLWQRLSKAVCRGLTGRKGRIPVNDSKQLKSQAVGIKHLEVGCLSFAAVAGLRPVCVGSWLDAMGETRHHDLNDLPWYAAGDERPWDPLPAANSPGEIAVARGLLTSTAKRIGVEVPDLAACVVFEDRFNQMVAATRSKAATSFTFVAHHLDAIWQRFGEHEPVVVVDRQGGRSAYRELLQQAFPAAAIRVMEETPTRSAYRLAEPANPATGAPARAMRVSFQVDADCDHMPVALASMLAKYTRELLMARFNGYFTARLPEVKPTAGYALDARRFWQQVQPRLNELGVDAARLCRVC